jgi:hypothetical protein
MKKILSLFLLFPAAYSFAQNPEDAVRLSFYPQNGTARNMATGGVMGSLGGDLTATFVNPAGLGFYKTREIALTPGLFLNNQKTLYRDSSNRFKKNNFGFGPSGVIIGRSKRNSLNSDAFAVAITQTANFNNTIRYSSLNNFSSFGEMFAEEFAYSPEQYTIDEVLNTVSPMPYTAALGLYTYLIDTATINGNTVVRAATENILDAGGAIRQDMLKTTTGGMYELAIAGAYNEADKWYFGGTFGLPIVNYNSKMTYSEYDTSASTLNGFNSFTYKSRFNSVGVGVNAKLGIIYRPEDYIRFGLAVHSPSFIYMRDENYAELETNLESASGVPENFNANSLRFTNNQAGVSKYVQQTAWRAILSGSYVFREVENVKRQRGFISADIEYVNHRSNRFRSDSEEPEDWEKNYYKALNNVNKDIYKGAFNFRVGGELKFNVIMARLGFGYYGNPYKKIQNIKANRMLLSGGLGYRHKGMFIDLTYAYQIHKNADFPYRLQDRENTYAATKQNLGNVVATLGWKF